MKYYLASILFFINVCISVAQDSRAIDFNMGWKFFKGDGTDFERSSYNDSEWKSVLLPHDWSVEGPFSNQWASATGYLPAGIGWYRKSFEVYEKDLSKITYIYFDGVYKNSEVWINDRYLGKRPNGFIPFYYDLSPHLKKGKNVIVVKADHADYADSRWYTGSGIYRNVYLLQLQPVHIGIWGQRFVTPEVSKEKATTRISVNVMNTLSTTQTAKIDVKIFNRQQQVIGSSQSEIRMPAGENTEAQLSLIISNPELWSPGTPVLYQLQTSVTVNGKVVDVLSEKIGIRYFSFDADKGFTLNGINTKLKGVCIHDDAGAFGSAVPAAVWERRLKTLKQMGCNAIRMSHNPHQDYLYDLCDRLGFLVQDEAFDEWIIGKNKWIDGWNVGTPGKDGTHAYFAEWSDRDLTDMILRNKNHPGIIMWSIGNEIDYPNDPYTHEVLNTGRNPQIYGKGFQPSNPEAKQLGEIAQRLVAAAKKADATRPVTAALAGVVMSNETTYPEQLDVVGYNYQEYRYADDHQKYARRIIYGSENGHSYEGWKAVEDNAFISGQFLWTGFDFLGEARSWPSRSSGAGLIDMAGFPKAWYYFRKALWSAEPVVYCAVSKISPQRDNSNPRAALKSHWNWQPGDSVQVSCFSNAGEVELSINGKSHGIKTAKENPGKAFSWRTIYEPGEVNVIGRSEGKAVGEYRIQTAASPALINITADRLKTAVHRDSVVHIVIMLADNKSVVVSHEERQIELIVTGPAKLLGIESGSLDSHEDYRSNKRKTLNGKLVAYVQATGKGNITVQARSENMISQKVEIVSTKIK